MSVIKMVETCKITGENHQFLSDVMKGKWADVFFLYVCADCTGLLLPSDQELEILQSSKGDNFRFKGDFDDLSEDWGYRLLRERFGEEIANRETNR